MLSRLDSQLPHPVEHRLQFDKAGAFDDGVADLIFCELCLFPSVGAAARVTRITSSCWRSQPCRPMLTAKRIKVGEFQQCGPCIR